MDGRVTDKGVAERSTLGYGEIRTKRLAMGFVDWTEAVARATRTPCIPLAGPHSI